MAEIKHPLSAQYQAAIANIAHGLARARLPLICGLSTDVDGLRAAFQLAHVAKAALSHGSGAHLATELRLIADTGVMSTTPAEARQRADLLVLVGQSATTYAQAVDLVQPAPKLYPWRGEQKVISLQADARTIGLLRALCGSRAVARDADDGTLKVIAEALRAAKFSVLVFDAAELGSLGSESLLSLVKELNTSTRATTLAVPPQGNARAALSVSAWTMGDALPLGLGRGYPESDAWRFDAERMIASGETDYVLYLGGLEGPLPSRLDAVIAPASVAGAAVRIEIGVPGIDHDAVLYHPLRDALVFFPASMLSPLPRAADVLTAIADHLKGAA